MAAQEEVFQMLIILPETLDFDSVLNSICAWPYSYQGKTQMLFKMCLFCVFQTLSVSGLTVIRVRHRYCFLFAYFACFRHGCWILFKMCFICVFQTWLFDSFLRMLNFSRVAFVFSWLILIKAWQNKRAGGLENGLFCVFQTWLLDTV